MYVCVFVQGAIAEMNRLGMVIDVAGSIKSVQETVIQNSEAPVIYRGVALKSRVNNTMNVDADTLEKLVHKIYPRVLLL